MSAASTLAPGVARKLKKVLDTRTTDNPDVLASLATLSSFYAENTPQARRNLKSSIEQRGLTINDHFLDASLPAQLVRFNLFPRSLLCFELKLVPSIIDFVLL